MVLAISNPHRKDLGRFVIRTVIGEVPYLKEVKIKKRNDRDIYHGKWVADQYTKVGTRTLSTRKEPLKIEAGKRTDLEIELQFSNPIFGDPDVSFLDGTQKLGEARLSSSKKLITIFRPIQNPKTKSPIRNCPCRLTQIKNNKIIR